MKKVKCHTYACRVDPDPPEPLKCSICGKPAVALCDYRESWCLHPVTLTFGHMDTAANPLIPCADTCSKPLCADHAFHVGKDEDYCPDHCSQISRRRSRMAKIAFRKMCRKLDLSVPDSDT